MLNEEIITALRNAIEHGESLSDAIQIMMNSGYNPAEVQEASIYMGGGALNMQQPRPDEHLVMPRQRTGISKVTFWKNQKPAQQPPTQQPKIIQTQQFRTQQQIQQNQPQVIQSLQFQQQAQQQIPQAEQFPIQQIPQYSQVRQSSIPLTKQLEKIKPSRPSYFKEIFLLIILLILIGALISTILYKDTILAWFA